MTKTIVFTTELPSKQGAYLYRPNKNCAPVWIWYNAEHNNSICMEPARTTTKRMTKEDFIPGAEFAFIYAEDTA